MKYIYTLILLWINLTSFSQQTVGIFQNDSLSLNGYTLLANLNSTQTYLIDNCGDIVNSWRSSGFIPGPVVYLLEDGSLLRTCKLNTGGFIAGGSGGRLERYSWNDSLMWSYNFNSTTQRQHHDVNVLPNGNILVLSWDLYTKTEAILAGLDTNLYSGEIWSEKVVEISPVGTDSATIVWEWKLWDHLIQDFDSNANNFGNVSSNSQLVDLNYINNNSFIADYFHANALDYNPILDQIIISVRNYDEFWIIDHSTTTAEAASNSGGNAGMGGDILYRWGNPETYQQGTLADKKLFGQHNPNWIPQGYRDAGKIIVFNNGFNDSNMVSRVNIINPPLLPNNTYAKTAGQAYGPTNVDWTYTLPLFVDFVSGAARLENGNTFITSGPNGHLYELDNRDSLVWEYVSPLEANNVRASQGSTPSSNSLFRAYRYSENYSAFNGRNLQGTQPIELNPLPTKCILYPNIATQLESHEQNNQLSIYPNPATNELIIQNSNEEKININVYNLQGKLVYTSQVTGKQKKIDCGHWSSGAYIAIFDSQKKFHKQKIIKL